MCSWALLSLFIGFGVMIAVVVRRRVFLWGVCAAGVSGDFFCGECILVCFFPTGGLRLGGLLLGRDLLLLCLRGRGILRISSASTLNRGRRRVCAAGRVRPTPGGSLSSWGLESTRSSRCGYCP